MDFEINTWTETDRKATIGFISITCLRGGRSFSERLTSGNLWISIKDGRRIGLRGGGGKTESVLKDGRVYKLSIPNTGIYSLSGAFIRDQMGVNLSEIDVDRINVYGNEGGRIPESNLTSRTDDLEQLPCLSIGLEDGTFNETDRLIFYTHGPHAWKRSGQQWELETNIYDDNNYVFVKLDGEPRKEINIESSLDVADHRTSYIEREYYGKDDLNLLGRSISHQGSGKIWMSDEISNSREIDLSNSFHFGEAILGSTFSVKCHFYGRAESRISVEPISTLRAHMPRKVLSKNH